LPPAVGSHSHQPATRQLSPGRVQQGPDGVARPGHVAGEDKGEGRRRPGAAVRAAAPLQGEEPCRNGCGRSSKGRFLPATHDALWQRPRVRTDDGNCRRTARGLQGTLKEGGAVVHQR
jgi:hypothetical protein